MPFEKGRGVGGDRGGVKGKEGGGAKRVEHQQQENGGEGEQSKKKRPQRNRTWRKGKPQPQGGGEEIRGKERRCALMSEVHTQKDKTGSKMTGGHDQEGNTAKEKMLRQDETPGEGPSHTKTKGHTPRRGGGKEKTRCGRRNEVETSGDGDNLRRQRKRRGGDPRLGRGQGKQRREERKKKKSLREGGGKKVKGGGDRNTGRGTGGWEKDRLELTRQRRKENFLRKERKNWNEGEVVTPWRKSEDEERGW